MDIQFLTWEIREPLKPRPVAGALCGALTGLLFGLIADQADFGVGRSSIMLGYVMGGAVAGLLIGGALPLFRNRVIAGVVVSVAASIGLLLVHWFWEDSLPPEASLLIGCSMGFTYAVLFWKYKP